jgi:7,8-dihydroneopterin aldolase/epimerase/oxygenase
VEPPPLDCIHVEQLEVLAHVGVTENERATSQRLTISMSVWPRRPFAELGDDIGNTVDYSALAAAARDFVEGSSSALVETLADNLAATLLQAFPIREIWLEVRKFVVPNTKYVAVSLRRQAKD